MKKLLLIFTFLLSLNWNFVQAQSPQTVPEIQDMTRFLFLMDVADDTFSSFEDRDGEEFPIKFYNVVIIPYEGELVYGRSYWNGSALALWKEDLWVNTYGAGWVLWGPILLY